MSETEVVRKQCPQCGQEVTRLALVCSGCGYEFVSGSNLSRQKPENFWANPSRPRGVTILTIYFVIFAGLFPMMAVILVSGSAEAQEMLGVNWFSIAVSILLGVGVIIAAIGTWKGDNRARILLIILVTIHYVLVAYNNAQVLFSGLPIGSQGQLWGRVFRGVLYPAITIWYFTRPTTMAFFKAKNTA